jgi:hypothetical protein
MDGYSPSNTLPIVVMHRHPCCCHQWCCTSKQGTANNTRGTIVCTATTIFVAHSSSSHCCCLLRESARNGQQCCQGTLFCLATIIVMHCHPRCHQRCLCMSKGGLDNDVKAQAPVLLPPSLLHTVVCAAAVIPLCERARNGRRCRQGTILHVVTAFCCCALLFPSLLTSW